MTCKNQEGSALIAATILGLLILGAIFWYAQWAHVRIEGVLHRGASRHAVQYADSGIQQGAQLLRSPILATILNVNETTSYSLMMPNGRVDVRLDRPSVGLVLANTTGYYFLSKGSAVDPVTGQNAQMAAVNAKLQLTNISQFLFAQPANLKIGYGTNASSGTIYGTSLTFQDGGACPPTPSTIVDTVLYYISYTLPASPNCVQNSSGGFPNFQKLPYLPTFAYLDTTIRTFYSARTMLAGGALDGVITAPVDPSKAGYLVNGDVDIGSGGPVTASGVFIIYATGNVYIHNNITPADSNSWVAILSEMAIHITGSARLPRAPSNLTLYGNYVANLGFTADTPYQLDTSVLNLYGGIVSMTSNPGIDVSTVYKTRSYTYQTVAPSVSSELLLPNFTTPLEYSITSGKYAS